ncbi:hypothetical protein [Ornithinimicrobium sp. INDO-MA30-4]|uniref:nucleotide-binding protein n=1 Tax=Ornithinimicrobium sp. INDO-MA30-4 TaxID=2908651 RepID=UPI001F42D607|nr:hypothetical protein [Ornithinimicrobium sp. INDO-MA30-4]UJH69968.1 hypothetical protein L0A91_12165 [Ornithinimicrobium sp. INDO-MA30-4]
MTETGAPTGAIMVVGATSGAGKSTVAAALCRSFARKGLRVAPFKAQNMSNHSAVTADGGEVGRSQAVQAHAARVELDRRMNPILLKPTRNASHVVVLGDEVSTTNAADYGEVAKLLRSTVLSALDSLRGDYPIVVAEGAGGAAEINLLDRDLVNLPWPPRPAYRRFWWWILIEVERSRLPTARSTYSPTTCANRWSASC